MLTDQPEGALLAQFVNALPDAAVYLEAVRDEQHQLTDLLVAHGNEKGCVLVAQGVFNTSLGESILGDNAERRALLQPVFRQYAALLLTGETQEFDFLNPVLHRVVHVTRSRLGDGVLVVVRDPAQSPGQKSAKPELADQLSGILEASLNGIITYEAIRNDAGTLVDFRFVRLNQAALRMLNLTTDVVGKPMLDELPGVKEIGLFSTFVKVVETSAPDRLEVPFPAGDRLYWYDMSVVKLGDGFVVTFNDITDRKQAEQRIEQQAEELRTTFDSSVSGIFTMTAIRDEYGVITDFRFRNANRAVKQNLNKEPEEMIGHTLLELFPGNIETGFFDVYARVANTGQSERYLQYYTDSNKFEGWFDVSVVKQEPDGVINTFLNVTEQINDSLENKQQADLLNNILDSSGNGIMSLEAVRDEQETIVDFTYLTGNEAAGRMLGHQVAELLGNRLLTYFPTLIETELFGLYVHTVETGEPGRTVMHYPYDGLDTWFDISTRQLGHGLVVTFADVSESKRVTKAIEQSAVELQTVIDTSQTGIFLFAPVRDAIGEVVDFRFRVANRQLASYVGQTPEVVTGALGSTWFPDYKTNGLFERYRHTYLTGEQLRFDFHYDGSGIDVWLDIMSTKIGDEVLVTFGDYTPLKKLQQQLEASVIDLQRSNRNLEQFAYVASHDLQEPLRKIQAFSDILQTQYAPVLGPEGIDMLRRMQSAANRMQVLIRDVLAYSRIATKREAIKPVDLNTLVGDVLSDLETIISDKKAIIHMGALPTTVGDAPQLRQLFQNLISNSLKFTRPERTPELRLTCRMLRGREARMPVSVADETRLFYEIGLVDNGIGFDPRQAERIFQVFQRLHGRSEYQGTGIGLAIVQKVVENHQGYIQAEGKPGEGAVFRVLLPV